MADFLIYGKGGGKEQWYVPIIVNLKTPFLIIVFRWPVKFSKAPTIPARKLYAPSFYGLETVRFIFEQRLQREARVWSSLHHPNITPFYGVSFDFDRPGRAVLVSQYCRHGDLQRYLARHAGVDKLLLV